MCARVKLSTVFSCCLTTAFACLDAELTSLDWRSSDALRRDPYSVRVVDYEAFKELVNILKDDLKRDEVMAKRSKGTIIIPEVKVAIALRFLAGGSPLDLRLIYHVSKSYVYECV